MSLVIAITKDSEHFVVSKNSKPSPLVIATSENNRHAVVMAGTQGPAGAQGPIGPDGASTFQRVAGETISALRLVYENDNEEVFYIDQEDDININSILGLTITSASTGGNVSVRRTGIIDDDSWSWSVGRIWLGANGALTQSPPSVGFDVLIGAAVSSTRIILNIQDSILLEE